MGGGYQLRSAYRESATWDWLEFTAPAARAREIQFGFFPPSGRVAGFIKATGAPWDVQRRVSPVARSLRISPERWARSLEVIVVMSNKNVKHYVFVKIGQIERKGRQVLWFAAFAPAPSLADSLQPKGAVKITLR
jgi:hypothetical protein